VIVGCDSGQLLQYHVNAADRWTRMQTPFAGKSDVLRVRASWQDRHCVFVGQRSGQVSIHDFRSADTRLPHIRLASSASSIKVIGVHTAILASMAGSLVLWDARMPHSPALTFDGHVNSRTHTLPLSIVKGGVGLLAAGGEDGTVRLWDCRTGGVPVQAMRIGDVPVSIAALATRWGRCGRAGMLMAAGDNCVFSSFVLE
jgi:WD40 repeat protein